MRSQLLRLLSLGALATTGLAADTSCVDCEATLVANSDWSNGVLAQGNYYQLTKTGNWLLGNSVNGEGQLELRNDPADGYYVWNLWYAVSMVLHLYGISLLGTKLKPGGSPKVNNRKLQLTLSMKPQNAQRILPSLHGPDHHCSSRCDL
jgi:hypothetical protein